MGKMRGGVGEKVLARAPRVLTISLRCKPLMARVELEY